MTNALQANTAERLHISEHEWQILISILSEYLPCKTVWAFGSRATGRQPRRFSDLDLAVRGKLTSAERAAVVDALDESLLSFKVDVVEMETVDAEFSGTDR